MASVLLVSAGAIGTMRPGQTGTIVACGLIPLYIVLLRLCDLVALNRCFSDSERGRRSAEWPLSAHMMFYSQITTRSWKLPLLLGSRCRPLYVSASTGQLERVTSETPTTQTDRLQSDHLPAGYVLWLYAVLHPGFQM